MKLITIVLIVFLIIFLIIIITNGELFTNSIKVNYLKAREYFDSPTETNTSTTPPPIIQSDKFRLSLDYKYYAGTETTKKNTIDELTTEFSKVLDSNDFTILDLYNGSIIIDIKFNDDKLHDKFVSLINDTSSSVYQQKLLKNIDTSYIVHNNQLAPIISKELNIIDELVNNNTPFMLSVTVPSSGVYPADMENPPSEKDVKLYLTIANADKNYSTCVNTSGMLSLQEKPTMGSIFTLNSLTKYIPKNTYPYNFIDYFNTSFNKGDNSEYIISTFYGLQAYGSDNNVSFCMQDCEAMHGFCAQESRSNTVSKKNGPNKTDQYGIKNYMKFIIENASKNLVTPYFISLDPEEKIHFLANNYNTLVNPDGYKQLVQVPIYEDNKRPYYIKPGYIDNNAPTSGIYTTDTPVSSTIEGSSNKLVLKDEEIVIKDLNRVLVDVDTDVYAQKNTMKVEETQVMKNDAYLNYALKFTIEKLTPEQITEINTSK